MNYYPKISIITPVRNNVKTLEKTIQSVIAQNYPNLEYIVIDGASNDGSVDIIKKYEKNISYWHSIADEGAVDATIKGIKIATGEIIAFINGDDFYENNTLLTVAKEFSIDDSLDIVSLCYRVLQEDSHQKLQIIDESTKERMDIDKNKIIISYGINARFFKKTIFEKYGLMISKDDKNRFFLSNDIEHLIRIVFKGVKNKTLDFIGYNYLSHDKSNTFARNFNTTLRLSEDKIFIAKLFLNSSEFELPIIWKKTFKKWLLKYRSFIVKLYLKNLNFSAALDQIKLGIKDNGFFKFNFYLLKKILFR